MSGDTPRIPPLDLDGFVKVHRETFEGQSDPQQPVLNITRTWAHHPTLWAAQRPYQRYLFSDSTLARRDQELIILRIGWLSGSDYELGQHTRFGLAAGLSEEEILRVAAGPSHPDWPRHDAILLSAADSLHAEQDIDDATWRELEAVLSVQQIMDLIVVVGRYWTVSTLLKTLRVPAEPDMPRLLQPREAQRQDHS